MAGASGYAGGELLRLLAEHPDYTGLPAEQAAARARLDEHQRKLRAYPSGLPGRVVVPQALAPLLASLVIAELGGYDVLFTLAGVVTVLGALSVARIRTVR